VSKFRKKDADLLQLEVYGTSLSTPYEIADDFSEHFQSIHCNLCLGVFLPSITLWIYYFYVPFQTPMFILVQNVLWPSKSAGLDCIHNFVIKVCSEIFVPVL
jgi:hypothetical protein